MRVEQMINSNGNRAVNQFVLTNGNNTVFQSYNSMIAEVDYSTRTILIGKNWDYSKTTGQYRNIFFNDYVNMPELGTKKGLEKAIKDGCCGKWSVVMV